MKDALIFQKNELNRLKSHYTRQFCEENVWHLGRFFLEEKDYSADQISVLFFTNKLKQVILFQQYNIEMLDSGGHPFEKSLEQPLVWDYHVVLCVDNSYPQVFDLDSRLPFGTPLKQYLQQTFPWNDLLKTSWQTWIRRVPLENYLRQFQSDRSHMLIEGRAICAFPNYPPIYESRQDANMKETHLANNSPQTPEVGQNSLEKIDLSRYLDLDAKLNDQSEVLALADWAKTL